jgi:hypothetical protein
MQVLNGSEVQVKAVIQIPLGPSLLMYEIKHNLKFLEVGYTTLEDGKDSYLTIDLDAPGSDGDSTKGARIVLPAQSEEDLLICGTRYHTQGKGTVRILIRELKMEEFEKGIILYP